MTLSLKTLIECRAMIGKPAPLEIPVEHDVVVGHPDDLAMIKEAFAVSSGGRKLGDIVLLPNEDLPRGMLYSFKSNPFLCIRCNAPRASTWMCDFCEADRDNIEKGWRKKR